MLYALRNTATGRLMAFVSSPIETDEPSKAVLYTSEKNARASIRQRQRLAAQWPEHFPADFTIVPLKLTEETI
ncbi:hypothetical protein NKH16_20105 [Mesorhizobium sp. M1307]|uniref:hypothetical protein n=1 Tax=unclassified Mesorhizobium TaxID=325217 RepID=UPI00333B2188